MSSPRGLIVIDKPVGPTSHDVVGKLRRLFQTKRVGHAGTLDPMATGVLVALVGEATKLSTWLVLDDKRYVARVAFGRSTDSLDATGKTTREEVVPSWLTGEVAVMARGDLGAAPRIGAAIAIERARSEQLPPAFSAIQKNGVRAHSAARAGRALALDARQVVVRSISSVGATADPPSIDVDLDVGKGYYVRSFARDLGDSLNVPACLTVLRRNKSGPFDIATATTLDDLARMPMSERIARILPLADVVRTAMRCATLTAEGRRKARMGQRIVAEHFAAVPPQDGPFAWMDEQGELISVGELQGEAFTVLRNFVGDEALPASVDVSAPSGSETQPAPEAASTMEADVGN